MQTSIPTIFAAIAAIGAIVTAAVPVALSAQETRLMSSSPITQTSDAESDIRALIASQAAAWNHHDAKAWAAPFVQSAEFINILGTPFSGKPAIEGITARIFATIFKDSRDSVSVQKIVWLSPELAIAHYEHAVSGYTALPPGIQPSVMGADGKGVLRTRMVYVLKKGVEGWQIVNGQNTAILPAFKAP
jgi:uncharacterized protein (TIGR02246 family)